MPVITMKELLEAGVHFGHQTKRWNPKMKKYIFGTRNDIYIIDLEQTVTLLDTAYHFVRDVAAEGNSILFVGTKRQAQNIIEEEAHRCGTFYVTQRWLGGMLTNFQTIRKSVDKLKKLEADKANGTWEHLPKKEVAGLEKEKAKLEKYLGGIRDMETLPGALFVVDTQQERTAVLEANRLGIPVVAIVDTNCDPDEIDYIIPGNDDAIRAVRIIASRIADAIIEGRSLFMARAADEAKALATQPPEPEGDVDNREKNTPEEANAY